MEKPKRRVSKRKTSRPAPTRQKKAGVLARRRSIRKVTRFAGHPGPRAGIHAREILEKRVSSAKLVSKKPRVTLIVSPASVDAVVEAALAAPAITMADGGDLPTTPRHFGRDPDFMSGQSPTPKTLADPVPVAWANAPHRPASSSFLMSFFGFGLALVLFGGLLHGAVNAATFQAPTQPPPGGNVPSTIWNRASSAARQTNASIDIDGDFTAAGMTQLGSATSAVAAGQNLVYGNVDAASAGSLLLLQSESRDRFRVDADGNVRASGCFGASFIGVTSRGGPADNGVFPVSAVGSYYAAHNKCNNALNGAAFVGSHVCTEQELLDSIRCSVAGDPIRAIEGEDGWLVGGPPGFTAEANDCTGWTSSSASAFGRFWRFSDGTVNGNNTTGGFGTVTSCNTPGVKFACCK